ncbi:methionyl-tRNA formyltransferase [Anaerolineae bacterium CFX7]|nr:methionyl-tRNA formyltransferase [Anaerolineae bacterium CFX7]
MKHYVVVGSKPWNRRVFDKHVASMQGLWYFVSERQALTLAWLDTVKPRYIFFVHWSWLVPKEITDKYECVCFHMTDVPFGRGGSPLQNLIVRGFSQTKLTALKMSAEVDAGPIYLKRELSLEGNAEEIYIRSNELAFEMIKELIRTEPNSVPQQGEPVFFARRKPAESEIPPLASLEELYNFIRMLDAEGYPFAFFVQDGFRYEFRRAGLYDNRIEANVTITQEER